MTEERLVLAELLERLVRKIFCERWRRGFCSC
jgi:hypothetical protein